MSGSAEFSERFSKMTDDQLIYEYGSISTLVPAAATALHAEVERRQLDTRDAPLVQHQLFEGGEAVALRTASSVYRKFRYWSAVATFVFLAFLIVSELVTGQ